MNRGGKQNLIARRNRSGYSRYESTRGLRLEPLEQRLMLNGDVVISELVASNALGLLDYDDDTSDWLEITNRGASNVDL